MRLDRDVLAVTAAAGSSAMARTETDVAALLGAMTRARTSPSADDTGAVDPTHDDTGAPDSNAARAARHRCARRWAATAPGIATAASLLLLEVDSVHVATYTTVAEQMAWWPAFGLPGPRPARRLAAQRQLGPVSAVDVRFIDRIASGGRRLYEPRDRPAARNSSANPHTNSPRRSRATRRERLAHAGVGGPRQRRRLLEVAERTGLAAREAGPGSSPTRACEWPLDSSADRWRMLVSGWLSALPAPTSAPSSASAATHSGATACGSFVEWLYPGRRQMDPRTGRHLHRSRRLSGVHRQPGSKQFRESCCSQRGRMPRPPPWPRCCRAALFCHTTCRSWRPAPSPRGSTTACAPSPTWRAARSRDLNRALAAAG